MNTTSILMPTDGTVAFSECRDGCVSDEICMGAHPYMDRRGTGTVVALIAALAFWVAGAQAAAPDPLPGTAPSSSGLIKPVIPPEEDNPQALAPPSAPIVGGEAHLQRGTDSGQRSWEDEKVKSAALHVAKNIPNVRKIQMCYALEEDEWWVSLFDDIGVAVDVKQFVWNRDLQILEPFLVQKRIPRGQLDEYLSRRPPGRACEVIDPRTAAALSAGY